MKSFEKINHVFDIQADMELPTINSEPLEVEEQDDDFQLARKTLRNLITKNDEVIQDLIHISKNSEHPRAFEVAGQLIKTQSEIAKDLMSIHKQKKDITDGDSSSKINTQNNIVFAGSTSDLLKLISSTRAKTIDSN